MVARGCQLEAAEAGQQDLGADDALGELRRAASLLARAGLPHVADALRAVADDGADFAAALGLRRTRPGGHSAWRQEMLAMRRRLLRRMWRHHYGFVSRTAAARLIAEAWRAWETGTPVEPDHIEFFEALQDIGAQRLGWRQIADDLDETLQGQSSGTAK